MGVKRYVLAVEETIYCSDKEWYVDIDPDTYNRTYSAKIYLDIDPSFFLGLPGSKIVGVRVNGIPVWEGESLDVVEVNIDKNLLLAGRNDIYVEFATQALFCSLGVGNISGYLDLEGDYESSYEQPEKPPEPCKLFGLLNIGSMDPQLCATINTIAIASVGIIGVVILAKLILR